jgi:3'-5' exoribonuclease
MTSPSNNPFESLQTPLTKVSQIKAIDAKQSVAFASLLLVRKIVEKQAKNGAPFLIVELADKTGSFAQMVFSDSPYFNFFKSEAPEGSVITLMGMTGYYQDRLSPKILEAHLIPADDYHKYPVEELVAASTENPLALWEELNKIIAGISHEQLRQTVTFAITAIEPQFRIWPAGVSVHHAYRHGLMEHTVHVLRAALALLPLYPEVDRDLALAGIVLHDLGKVEEYTFDNITKFGRVGILHGHVVVGYRMARQSGLKAGLDAERLERLEHIVLSHQGKKEWGAAVMPSTPEAVFVSLVDNLDAKMGAVQAALRAGSENSDFSERIAALEAPLLLTPVGGRPEAKA